MDSTVGAPSRWVTPSARIRRHTSVGSTLGRQTWVAPAAVTAHGKHHPLQWNIGSVHRYDVAWSIRPCTTGRPKGVMYHHRGAYLQALAMVGHTRARPSARVPVDAADVPLQRLVLPVGGHRGRRHPRLPAAGSSPERIWRLIRARGRHPLQRRADGADRCSPTRRGRGGAGSRRPVRVATGGAPPSPALLRADGRARPGRHPPLRADRDLRPGGDLRLAARSGTTSTPTSRRGSRPARASAT